MPGSCVDETTVTSRDDLLHSTGIPKDSQDETLAGDLSPKSTTSEANRHSARVAKLPPGPGLVFSKDKLVSSFPSKIPKPPGTQLPPQDLALREELNALQCDFQATTDRFESVEERFDQQEARFDYMEQQINSLSTTVTTLSTNVNSILNKLDLALQEQAVKATIPQEQSRPLPTPATTTPEPTPIKDTQKAGIELTAEAIQAQEGRRLPGQDGQVPYYLQ
ncbi:Casein kinase I isoform delta [Perkinsus chesapeaki]|uniref:Casein kinase I isoform delta n=1 Tax=Perkinsus chesapeaki TaxID=330153 RepID=A0A7J6L4N7_PERCH|nr:Casein kinase I isoform delta [Perkinsus chesapeaki]